MELIDPQDIEASLSSSLSAKSVDVVVEDGTGRQLREITKQVHGRQFERGIRGLQTGYTTLWIRSITSIYNEVEGKIHNDI